jgi:hypothetical protein
MKMTTDLPRFVGEASPVEPVAGQRMTERPSGAQSLYSSRACGSSVSAWRGAPVSADNRSFD